MKKQRALEQQPAELDAGALLGAAALAAAAWLYFKHPRVLSKVLELLAGGRTPPKPKISRPPATLEEVQHRIKVIGDRPR